MDGYRRSGDHVHSLLLLSYFKQIVDTYLMLSEHNCSGCRWDKDPSMTVYVTLLCVARTKTFLKASDNIPKLGACKLMPEWTYNT